MCEEREQDILLVKACKRNKGVCVGNTLLAQGVLVGGICVYDRHLFKLVGQLGTAAEILLNYRTGYARVVKQVAEIVGDRAAADDQRVFDRLQAVSDLLEEGLCALGRGNDGDNVLLAEDEITVCNKYLVTALYGAEGDGGTQLCRHVLYSHTNETALLGQLEGKQLYASLGKGLDLDSVGEVKYSCNLLCRRQLGVDNHSQTKLVLEVRRVNIIFGVLKSCDSTAVCRLLCHKTAEQVKLVVARHGYKQVGMIHTGILLGRARGTVADNAHDIQLVCNSLNLGGVLVNYSDVVALRVQLCRKGRANLSASYDNYVHSDYLRYVISFSFAPIRAYLYIIHYKLKQIVCQVKG